MKRFSEQLKKQADTLHLSAAEQRDLKSRVVSYMEYHPRPGAAGAATAAATATATQPLWQRFYLPRAVSAFALVLLASVPFMAERSVPGDVLYPVKVRFNEEVQSSFARTPYAQIEWETERLERRLAEARILESEGKLTPEVAQEVADAVKQHSDAAQQNIEEMRVSDRDEAAIAEITLSSALDVQSEMLEGRSDTLAGAVNDARMAAAATEQDRPSYQKLIARIELESTNAQELFNTVTDQASETERSNIERRLTNIRGGVNRASELQQVGDTDRAVDILVTALTDTRKVISFMTDIDVRANVSIDQLIPIVLTDAERTTLIEERMAAVATMRARIAAEAAAADAATLSAIAAPRAAIDAQMATASAALAAGELTAADEASLTAHTIAEEVLAMLADAAAGGGVDAATPATSTGTTTSTRAPAPTVSTTSPAQAADGVANTT